jgi:ribosomal-protein-alanine N-acetyltransferase
VPRDIDKTILLETERLLFRTHEPQDEADFIAMHTDPEVRRYMGGQAWPLEKALLRFRDEYLGRPTKTFGLWATILKEEAKYIGSCGIRAGKNDSETNLGYILAQPYWRRGLVSEAAKAFIEIAFTRVRSNRLLADVEKGMMRQSTFCRSSDSITSVRKKFPAAAASYSSTNC